MSLVLPISFLLTLLCLFGAIDGALFRQLLFAGAAAAGTVMVCSLEAWSAREVRMRNEDRRETS
jgi:hypothetical protein